MIKSAKEIMATWPKWKRELAGYKERENMKKSLSERVVNQFKETMKQRKIKQQELADKLGVKKQNISQLFVKGRSLTLTTLEKIAKAIGGDIEINFIPEKTELELLREENERLKKMLGAKRYVENGTLHKK